MSLSDCDYKVLLDVTTRRGTWGETEDFFKLILINGCDARAWASS